MGDALEENTPNGQSRGSRLGSKPLLSGARGLESWLRWFESFQCSAPGAVGAKPNHLASFLFLYALSLFVLIKPLIILGVRWDR